MCRPPTAAQIEFNSFCSLFISLILSFQFICRFVKIRHELHVFVWQSVRRTKLVVSIYLRMSIVYARTVCNVTSTFVHSVRVSFRFVFSFARIKCFESKTIDRLALWVEVEQYSSSDSGAKSVAILLSCINDSTKRRRKFLMRDKGQENEKVTFPAKTNYFGTSFAGLHFVFCGFETSMSMGIKWSSRRRRRNR